MELAVETHRMTNQNPVYVIMMEPFHWLMFVRMCTLVPVDDPSVVQKEQGQHNLSSVELCSVFVKLSRPLDLKHEVSTIDVLHHKEEPFLGGGGGGGGRKWSQG